MKIVVDANVLFSALIKNSKTRKLILNYEGFLLFPSFIFEEIEKHKKYLLKKSNMCEEDFNKLLDIILEKFFIVPSKMLLKHRNNALKIVKNIDINDVIYFACALSFPESVIWSNDKKLKEQSKINVFNTSEIADLFK